MLCRTLKGFHAAKDRNGGGVMEQDAEEGLLRLVQKRE